MGMRLGLPTVVDAHKSCVTASLTQLVLTWLKFGEAIHALPIHVK